MNIEGSKIVVIGGAGFIGSHVVEKLLEEPVKEVVVFDNFSRGTVKNLEKVINHPRLSIFEGDIIHTDLLDTVLKGADFVFHLAALWLLHCHLRTKDGMGGIL